MASRCTRAPSFLSCSRGSISAVVDPRGNLMMPFLLLICAMAATISSPALVLPAAAAKSSFQLLREAIWLANNNAWGGSFTQLPHKQVTIQITSDISLYSWLPRLHPNATSLNVISNCSKADGTPRRCIVYGRHKYGVFRTFKWIKWSSSMRCNLFVDNFVFTNINGSVFEDVFCSITVKRSVFKNSRAWIYGGAAMRQVYPLSPQDTGWVAFPPAVFSNCQFINLTISDITIDQLGITGSAYRTIGSSSAWFYDSVFQNCSGTAINAAYGAKVSLVRCKFPGKVYDWDGLLDNVETIVAYGANYTMRKTQVDGAILLFRPFYDNFYRLLPRIPYITFCDSTLSDVHLDGDYPLEDISYQNGTVVFCNTTHGSVVDATFAGQPILWNRIKTCSGQCK